VTLHSRPVDGPRTLRASGDRWLFGYADVVTLLFACFAALYATQGVPVAQTTPGMDSGKPSPELSAAPTPPPATPIADEIAKLLVTEEQVHIDVATTEVGTVISLAEAGSFPVGKADLTPAAQRVIAKLADLLRSRPAAIRVEGHTDDVPIRTSKYESNWELSTARASRVVVFLVEQGGLAPDRLSAAGYGEYRPKVLNDSPASRARNRRVDIVVLQETPAQADYGVVGIRPSDRR
jgi:chemotaxis protein MotB